MRSLRKAAVTVGFTVALMTSAAFAQTAQRIVFPDVGLVLWGPALQSYVSCGGGSACLTAILEQIVAGGPTVGVVAIDCWDDVTRTIRPVGACVEDISPYFDAIAEDADPSGGLTTG